MSQYIVISNINLKFSKISTPALAVENRTWNNYKYINNREKLIPSSFFSGLEVVCSGFFGSGFLAASFALAAAGPGSFFAYVTSM